MGLEKLERYNKILNDIVLNPHLTGVELSNKYIVSTAYISQIKGRIRILKYPPKVMDNKVVCYLCNKKERLCIHHNREEGEIAILCISCNAKVRNKGNLESFHFKSDKLCLMKLYKLMQNNFKLIKNLNDEQTESLKYIEVRLGI